MWNSVTLQPVTPQPWVGNGLNCFPEATLFICSRTFAGWIVGVLLENQSRFPRKCWLISHHTASQLCQGNITWVEIQRSRWWVWVCIWGLDRKLNHRVVYHYHSSLLQPCSPKCGIPLNRATATESPWDQWPPCLPLFLFLSHKWGWRWAREQPCW